VSGSLQNWYDDDDDTGPMVRLYALTKGRARSYREFIDVIALVVGNTLPENAMTLTPEETAILRLCQDNPGKSSMASVHSDVRSAPAQQVMALKILVAGGFGVGKTTLVGTVSEIKPLRTEEYLTEASRGVDHINGVEQKNTTTVAMDFGRITLNGQFAIYLFGTPGQDRFWFFWDDIAQGALGAIVLADTRRLQDCFPAVDYFESREIPFIVAVNCFAGARRYQVPDIFAALDLDAGTPVVLCDARDKESAKEVLIAMVEHAGRVHASASKQD
jgi:signal recognition particle receptor subunit beta